jgi:hypothetical protein
MMSKSCQPFMLGIIKSSTMTAGLKSGDFKRFSASRPLAAVTTS